MISAAHVNKIYERNLYVINKQVEGLTHQDSLLQPEFRANCMNWVLGHMLDGRQDVIELLGLTRNVSEDLIGRYGYDSEPISAGSTDALDLPVLLEHFEESGKLLAKGFADLDEERWLAASNEKGTPLWKRVEFLVWHEAYHVGQLELLRQLAGKNDKVI
ncbi:MAG: DinB family protein [Chloroflexota bacterium]